MSPSHTRDCLACVFAERHDAGIDVESAAKVVPASGHQPSPAGFSVPSFRGAGAGTIASLDLWRADMRTGRSTCDCRTGR